MSKIPRVRLAIEALEQALFHLEHVNNGHRIRDGGEGRRLYLRAGGEIRSALKTLTLIRQLRDEAKAEGRMYR